VQTEGWGLAEADRARCGASNSKTRGKGPAKGRPLRGLEFMSELKLRPTKREAGAPRRLFTQRFHAGLAYAAPPFKLAAGRFEG
jgi:hypothetical protein